jgi:hypothetical protein
MNLPSVGSEESPKVEKGEVPGRIPAGRFAAGLMIHLLPFVYLLAIGTRMLAEGRMPDGRTDLYSYGMLTVQVLVFWTLLTVATALLSSAGSALLRRRRRRIHELSPDRDAVESALRLGRADVLLTTNRGDLDEEAARRLEGIRTARWRHGDEDFQRLSADLLRVAQTLDRAVDRQAVAPHVSRSIAVLHSAVMAAEADHGRDEGERARILSEYIDARHGQANDVRRIP